MVNISNYISFIQEETKPFFDYYYIAKDMWFDLIKKAKKEFHISFDLENNDSKKGQQRDIIIPQNQWDFTSCKFSCELWIAGGDWEIPVYYFKCQLKKGYALNLHQYSNSFFIYIPGKEEGNYHLVKCKDNWCAPDGNDYKKDIDPEPSIMDCWKSLKIYLKKLVDLEIERVNSPNKEISE